MRLPDGSAVPLGGKISIPRAATAVEAVYGPNVMFPPDGASDTEIAIPYCQWVPGDEGIWFWAVSHLPGAAFSASPGARAQALIRDMASKINRGDHLSFFGWGNGPGNIRNLSQNSRGTVNAPGVGPLRTLEVLSRTEPELITGPRDDNNNFVYSDQATAGGYFTQRPTAMFAPSWARSRRLIRQPVWGFWCDIDPASVIDAPDNHRWTYEQKNPQGRNWTDNHPRTNYQQQGGRSAAYGANSGLPVNATEQSRFGGRGIQWVGGQLGHAAAFYLPIMRHLTSYRLNPTGDGVSLSETVKGNFGAAWTPAAHAPLLTPETGRNLEYYLYTDMACFVNLAAHDRGTVTRNLSDIAADQVSDQELTIDYLAGTAADGANLLAMTGQQISGPTAGASDVIDYTVEDWDQATEHRFRCRLEHERWTGAVYNDLGAVVGNPVHRVTLKVTGVAQWTFWSRLGLNGRTYYIDSIEGGGRLRRNEWVVEASSEYPIPAAPSNGG